MKYTLLIYEDEKAWRALSEEEKAPLYRRYMEISESPAVTGGAGLQPTTAATTVRVQDGQTLTTDGPFAETKEQLGGFYILEADDLDAAIEVASRIPAVERGGAIEIRPVVAR